MAIIDIQPALDARKEWDKARSGLPSSGGGGYDGGMEARVAKLEASVSHIERDVSDLRTETRQIRADLRQDFRTTWAGIIAVGLGLAAMMAKGFHWIG